MEPAPWQGPCGAGSVEEAVRLGQERVLHTLSAEASWCQCRWRSRLSVQTTARRCAQRRGGPACRRGLLHLGLGKALELAERGRPSEAARIPRSLVHAVRQKRSHGRRGERLPGGSPLVCVGSCPCGGRQGMVRPLSIFFSLYRRRHAGPALARDSTWAKAEALRKGSLTTTPASRRPPCLPLRARRPSSRCP